MSITTYAELQTAVANWINRDDLTSRIPEFIALTEAQINRRLRVRRMLQRSYADISTEFAALPDDWAGIRNIDIINSSIRYPLQYRTPEQMDTFHGSQTAQPRYYTILGDEFQFWPVPDVSYRIDISYYKAVPALTTTNTTNWLLTNHPDAYLFGAVAEAQKYAKNKPAYTQDFARFTAVIRDIHKADKRDKYAGSTLTMLPA